MAVDRLMKAGVGCVVAIAVAACVGARGPSATPVATASSPQSAVPAQQTPTPAASMISKEAALKAVQAFAGRAVDGTVTGPETMGIGTAYKVEGANMSAAVDATSGRVISLLLFDRMPGSTRTLTNDQALAAARKYVTDHGITVDGMRSNVEWMDHGGSGNYAVTWQLYQGEIQMPELTSVELDGASAEVFNFFDYRSPHGKAPDPKLTRQQAEAKALAASGVSNPGVKTDDLVFTRPMTDKGVDPNGPLALVWQIAVDTKTANVDEGCIVWVNDGTGEAQVIGRH